MYNILVHAHSGWRWVVLVLLLVAIVYAYTKWKAGERLMNDNRQLPTFAMIATHIQVLLGLLLYFIDGKNRVQFNSETMSDSVIRFFTVEHALLMIIAVVLITIGHKKAKQAKNFKPIVWYYGIGLILILSRIPWPGQFGSGWF